MTKRVLSHFICACCSRNAPKLFPKILKLSVIWFKSKLDGFISRGQTVFKHLFSTAIFFHFKFTRFYLFIESALWKINHSKPFFGHYGMLISEITGILKKKYMFSNPVNRYSFYLSVKSNYKNYVNLNQPDAK